MPSFCSFVLESRRADWLFWTAPPFAPHKRRSAIGHRHEALSRKGMLAPDDEHEGIGGQRLVNHVVDGLERLGLAEQEIEDTAAQLGQEFLPLQSAVKLAMVPPKRPSVLSTFRA